MKTCRHRYVIGFGTGLNHAGKAIRENTRKAAISLIIDQTASSFPGGFLQTGVGLWGAVREIGYTLTIELELQDDEKINDLARFIRDTLDQESVLVSRHQVESELI